MKNTDSRVVDLTHSLSSEIPGWEIDCGFRLAIEFDYHESPGPDFFRTQKVTSRLGTGTHIDAPAHFFPDGKTIDSLAVEDLVSDCVVINVSENADHNYLVMPEVVEKFEKKNGKLTPNSFVIFYTGWDNHWNNPKKYQNNHLFPSVHEATAQLLLERNISGLGIDTLSADAGGKLFPVHRKILGAGKYLVENVANASVLPATGSKIFVMPMKVEGGTEAPIRLVATL